MDNLDPQRNLNGFNKNKITMHLNFFLKGKRHCPMHIMNLFEKKKMLDATKMNNLRERKTKKLQTRP